MRASRQNEYFAIILFFIGGLTGSVGIWFGYLISVGSIYWYFKHGQRAKGWIGPNLDEMQEELKAVDSRLFNFAESSKLPEKELRRLENRRRDLIEGIRQWEIEHKGYGA